MTQRSKWCQRFILFSCLLCLSLRWCDVAFPVCYTLMLRKTTELHVKVFQKVQQLVPQFAPTCAMADFEEASVAGFQHVYRDAGVTGCWFHYAQAVIKIVHLCLIWCCVVRSHDVHPCNMARLVQPHEVSSRTSDGIAMSGLAFSVASFYPHPQSTFLQSHVCDNRACSSRKH